MELREVKYFIAIAEEKNLSQAAKKLYISQPALSSFLSKIEAQSNTQFFSRAVNNSLELTKAGEIYLNGCKKILEIYNTMEKQVQELSTEKPQTIRIGVTDERFFRIVVNSVSLLTEIHPNVQIQVVIFSAVELIQKILKGELDLAHSAYIESEKEPGLEYIKLTSVEIDLVVPLFHPLANHTCSNNMAPKRISLNQINNSPMVLQEKSTIFQKVVDKYFEQQNYNPNVKALVNNSYSTLSVVETGLFLGLVPESFHSDQVAYMRLDPPLHYVSGLYYKKNSYLTRAIKDFIDILKETSQINLTFPHTND